MFSFQTITQILLHGKISRKKEKHIWTSVFGSNNPGSQFWKQPLSNESPSFQCICPLQNRAVDTCLSHYSDAPPQELLNNTLAEQTSGFWTHKPFAFVQGRHFSAWGWTIKLRDHIRQDLLLPWVFPTNLSCRALEAQGCREHSPHFPPASILPLAQPGTGLRPAEKHSRFSHLLHLPHPIPRGIQKANRANRYTKYVIFEPSNQSPRATSLKNSWHKISLVSWWPLQANWGLLWNYSTSTAIGSSCHPKLSEKTSSDPSFSLPPIITFQMFLLFLQRGNLLEKKL